MWPRGLTRIECIPIKLKRREFMTRCSEARWPRLPLGARAQQPAIPVMFQEPVTLASGDGVLEVRLTARQGAAKLDTVATPVKNFLLFDYQVIRGTASDGQMSGGSLHPAPTFQVFPGETLIVHLENGLWDLTIWDCNSAQYSPKGETVPTYPGSNDLIAVEPSASRCPRESERQCRQRPAARPSRHVQLLHLSGVSDEHAAGSVSRYHSHLSARVPAFRARSGFTVRSCLHRRAPRRFSSLRSAPMPATGRA